MCTLQKSVHTLNYIYSSTNQLCFELAIRERGSISQVTTSKILCATKVWICGCMKMRKSDLSKYQNMIYHQVKTPIKNLQQSNCRTYWLSLILHIFLGLFFTLWILFKFDSRHTSILEERKQIRKRQTYKLHIYKL